MRDILLFADHPDPQIRGNLSLLVASYINSTLFESKGFKCKWIDDDDYLCVSNLLDIIFKVIRQRSKVCGSIYNMNILYTLHAFRD